MPWLRAWLTCPMAQRLTEPGASFVTHEVTNQPPPLQGRNLFDDNVALVEALEREGAGWARGRAREVGAAWGGDPVRWGFEANEHPPVLHSFDRYGQRIDEVGFHRAWHDLMRLATSHELHSLPWTSPEPAAHAARTALYLTAAQPEAGFACPITMTFAAVPALRAEPELAAEWEPRLTATSYDPELGAAKASALCGMAMTEKQGGSDVRANTTVARALRRRRAGRVRADGPQVVLLGADVRPVPRARTGRGRPLLLRVAADPARRHAQRASRSSASRTSSATVRTPRARSSCTAPGRGCVGEPGRGVPTIIEMVGHTRLDCVIGTAAGMRWGVANATWHAAHRSAFGARLADQPLMRNVLADLCIESEAATATAMRLARAYDEAAAGDARRRRLQADRDGDREVLGLQARAGARVRGARVPRWQRLRRGIRDAAAVPRDAAVVDLGGLGQRHGARRPARARAWGGRGRCPATPSSTSSALPPAPTRASTRSSCACAPSSPTASRSSPARAPLVERWRSRCRARCSCATRRPRSPTRSAPRGWPVTAGCSTERCPGASTRPRSSRATPRPGDPPRRRPPRTARPRAAIRGTPVRCAARRSAPATAQAPPCDDVAHVRWRGWLDPDRTAVRHPDRCEPELVRRPVRPHLPAVGLLRGGDRRHGHRGLPARGRRRAAAVHVDHPARARPRARRAAAGDRHQRDRPVVLRRHRADEPRHRLAGRGVQDRGRGAGRDAPSSARSASASARRISKGAALDVMVLDANVVVSPARRAARLPRAVEHRAAGLQPRARVPARRRPARTRAIWGSRATAPARPASRGASASTSPTCSIGLGCFLAAAGDPINGIYSRSSAGSSRRARAPRSKSTVFTERIDGITVADIMDAEPVTMPAAATRAARPGRVLPALPLGVVPGRRRARALRRRRVRAAHRRRDHGRAPGARGPRARRRRRGRALARARPTARSSRSSPTRACARTGR